jgi:hypothetical protein
MDYLIHPFVSVCMRGEFLTWFEANGAPGEGAALLPEDVAHIIGEAVQADEPETRYKVGAEAEQLPALRRKISDREWDAMYRDIFGAGG